MAKEQRGFASTDEVEQRKIAIASGKAAYQSAPLTSGRLRKPRDASRKRGTARNRRIKLPTDAEAIKCERRRLLSYFAITHGAGIDVTIQPSDDRVSCAWPTACSQSDDDRLLGKTGLQHHRDIGG